MSKFLDITGLTYFWNKIKAYVSSGFLPLTATAANTQAILYGAVDSTSTATVFTATVPGMTELKDGACVVLKNGVITSASGFTLNVNGLGALPVYSNMAAATRETTIFNISYTLMFIYDSSRVSGGCWVHFRGYYSDANSTGYMLRTNSYSRPVESATYRYRILFSSADDTKWVPSNNSTSTNATASRAVCQTPINPFGEIVYYSATTALSAGTKPGATTLWQQYNVTFGYSFNRTGAALALTVSNPVYIKCAPQSDGSAIIDADTPYVHSLPSAYDGKIYILIGYVTSATAVELLNNKPVYCIDSSGRKRPWLGSFDVYTDADNTLYGGS